ncbi:MAG TPA: tetratricopeptide repeat-containing glycosyltransferase family protein [Alphaproteobacteria bacterium]|nr:tetratricopeptide repeat-containing glycosyltransferase family protein [Alphaproteobacteria bacterium]
MSEPATVAEALGHIGALYRAKRFSDAVSAADRSLARHARDSKLWNARGVCLRSDNRLADAIDSYRTALRITPHDAAVWSNLGNVLKDAKQIRSAVVCHRRAIQLAPKTADFHHNLGIALMSGGLLEDAVRAFDSALEGSDDPKVLWDRAHARLRLGDFRRGWLDYESRFRLGALPERARPGTKWTGQNYAGRRLVVLTEQGFGDTLWAARYFAKAKALGGELIVECRPELASLVHAMPAVDGVVLRGAALPAAEYHCHVCSLPGLFTPDVGSIPGDPYLWVPAAADAAIDVGPLASAPAPATATATPKLRVGIVWSGSTTFAGNRDRAVALDAFLRAFAWPQVELYSLQKGPPREELRAHAGKVPVIDLAPFLTDFQATAAIVSRLDLVIMTDSAVAHLCGALGRPVWVLLNFVPYWLWGAAGRGTPWYPSMRLFRQKSWNDWSSAFDEASAELLALSLGTREAAEDA